MMDITADQNYISTAKIINYDNNGDPEVKLEISAGPVLYELEDRLRKVEAELNEMRVDRIQDAAMRQKNPALQDLYEKYKVMLCLLKEPEHAD